MSGYAFGFLNSKIADLRGFEVNLEMGVSIVLYKIDPAERFEDLLHLEKQLESETAESIDLYKMYHDLAIILANDTNPYNNIHSIPYKVLFGIQTRGNAGSNEIGGFIPPSMVKEINEWIIERNLSSFRGFYNMYTALNDDVKEELLNIDSPPPEELFAYIHELAGFYQSAFEGGNSILICAE